MSFNQGNPPSRNEMASCLSIALHAAAEAGDAIMEIYGSAFSVEFKDDRSPLTLADRRSHEIIAGRLREGPEGCATNPVLSEEGREIPFEERRRWKDFWLIDPLDGTKEFIKRNGEFTVNIALIRGHAPVMGVVFVPAKGMFYFAAEGLGARRMDAAAFGALDLDSGDPDSRLETVLKSSVALPLEEGKGPNASGSPKAGLTIAGSRSHASEALNDFLEEMKGQYGDVQFISAGSSLKFCLVAEGKADIYPRFGPTMEWDSAAGQCIVEQAGGKVFSMEDGLPLAYNRSDLRNPFFVCEGKGVRVFNAEGGKKE
jgi:3'(2'), 5'-bisphosphate nucleotidase